MRSTTLALCVVACVGCRHSDNKSTADEDLVSVVSDLRPVDLFGVDAPVIIADEDLAVVMPTDLLGADLSAVAPDLRPPPPDLRPIRDIASTDLSPTAPPVIAACSIFPSNHIFNTPINQLPVHPNSADFIATIGAGTPIHLDLGKETNQQDAEYWGIPYNVIDASSFTWASVAFTSVDTDLDWNPETESDCAATASHTFYSPCTPLMPLLPIPASPLVEGGIDPDTLGPSYEYHDHHILLLDTDQCHLWEVYHAYTGTSATWHIFGSAFFDLSSNALRPKGWTSADAAGFPILPLLIRRDEAQSGEIRHALRFTIDSDQIRTSYVWPARHLTNNGDDAIEKPPMGQLFRLKDTFDIPSGWSTQSKAIARALQIYGMYLADGGSNMYVQGEPNANWDDAIFDEIQSIEASEFEAVDISAITSRSGWNEDSAAVPSP